MEKSYLHEKKEMSGKIMIHLEKIELSGKSSKMSGIFSNVWQTKLFTQKHEISKWTIDRMSEKR